MARRKKKEEGRKRDPTLVMFLALNMILLAFFILLTALSNTNETKEAELAMEVRKAFKTFGGSFMGLGNFLDVSGLSREQHPITETEKVESFLGELSRFVEENKESKAFSYEVASEGLRIHVSEAISFRQGSEELLKTGKPLFNNILNLILRTSNPVRIEGHTDNVDIRTNTIKDNWELSTQRAMNVYRFLNAGRQVPETRFTVVGYGDQRPLTSNLTERGRERNRRVTIVFVGKLKRLGE